MTQIFALHSAYGLATAAAAIDEGLLGGGGDRVLVPFVSARVPEIVSGVGADPALAAGEPVAQVVAQAHRPQRGGEVAPPARSCQRDRLAFHRSHRHEPGPATVPPERPVPRPAGHTR